MKSKRKLRVFEAFAGIGAQAAALKKLNIDYEIVGISDWFIDAIECYATIHCESKVVDVPNTKAEVLEYLSKFTFSADSVHPYITQHRPCENVVGIIFFTAVINSKAILIFVKYDFVKLPRRDTKILKEVCLQNSTNNAHKHIW